MSESDIAFAGVAGQGDLLRRGELSARELTQLTLDRIARLDGELNAFTAVWAPQALAAADAADRRRAAGEDGPLLGIPMAVKDEMDVEGEVTSRGTGAFTARAPADAEVVRRLRAAGAVLVGRTAMPELGLWPFTESITWGVTRNPWDLDRTPGGSSGGSAAAVAAGMVPAALAGDGAGSIRIPAACTGLYGLKPQSGRVPRTPHDADRSHWIVFGALTRTVRDSGIVLDVLAGADGFAEAASAGPGRLRIAVDEGFPAGVLGKLSPRVAGALRETAALLRDLGHEVVEDDVPSRLRDAPVLLGLMFAGIRDFVHEVERPERLERRSRAMARPGALVSDGLRDRLMRAEARLRGRVEELFSRYDVVLTPVMSDTAVRAGLMEGRGATATYAWAMGWVPFLVLWNAMGNPAAAVPAGFDDDGLPLAVQLVGRPYAEQALLSLSAQLEAARPWAARRPALT